MHIVISLSTYYSKDRPPEDTFEKRVREIAAGHTVTFVPAGGDIAAAMPEADVYFPLSGLNLKPEYIEAAPRLEWAHVASAGVEHALFPAMTNSDIILTNGAGMYGIPIAEHTVGMMLALVRDFPRMMRQQAERKWGEVRGGELYGGTALIVGLGGIGREIARRLRAFGMRILATRRRPGANDPDADEVGAPEDLRRFLPLADWGVVTVPWLADHGVVMGRAEIALMKPSARLLNVGRGRTVDEAALIEALQSGRLAGAGLDVFEKEPLPPGSPLWDMPNVIVSPHTAGSSPRSLDRVLDLFLDNLRRFLAGEPLRNVVDKRAGY